ncbi:DMT family transporter [Plantactinospora sp. GCM10030261]|uniref:EamA family transporter n=1 Tax=Plantactinospora sp. GCM10030261 TaxID=3273420 RepID=UPI00361B1748
MRPRQSAQVGFVLAVVSAFTFATSGTFARSLLEVGWSAEAVVIARVGVAALVLAVPAILAVRGRWASLRGSLSMIGLFGLLGVATAQACFFNAVRYLPVGIALLLEYLGVILVVLWMWARHGHRPRRLTVIGAATAILGLVFVLDLTGAERMDPVGVLWGLGAAVGLAGYFVLAGRADAGVPPVALASGGMAVAALTLLGLGLVGALPLRVAFDTVTFAGQRTSWMVPVLGLSLVAAVVSYVTGIAATRRLGARLASFVGLTEVLFAVLVAWLFLAELPRAVQLLGGALIVAGVALVRVDELRAASVVPGQGPDAPRPPDATAREDGPLVNA